LSMTSERVMRVVMVIVVAVVILSLIFTSN
jgi:hypothetical protein